MASMSAVYAQSPTPSKSTTASPAAQTATPAIATPVASPSVFAPSTPPPPTPTPKLPEEGGPLGGHLNVDNDGSRSFTPGDSVWGRLVLADLLDSDGRSVALFGSAGDATGTWQIRALADGVYRL